MISKTVGLQSSTWAVFWRWNDIYTSVKCPQVSCVWFVGLLLASNSETKLSCQNLDGINSETKLSCQNLDGIKFLTISQHKLGTMLIKSQVIVQGKPTQLVCLVVYRAYNMVGFVKASADQLRYVLG